MHQWQDRLIRIGIFYDGQYFYNVSNYYAYQHRKRTRISIEGLHQFIRHQVAKEMNVDAKLCQVVDAHYFRGRLSAREANEQSKLYNERAFDDILMGENVVTHYMPLRQSPSGGRQEKGIDVWFALEAYELTVYKKFDVLVLIAGDGDYVPLVRKINTLGSRVMLICWDFAYQDEQGRERETRTSQQLLEEVTYPVAMHDVVEQGLKRADVIVNELFIPARTTGQVQAAEEAAAVQKDMSESVIISLKDGFGFIREQPNNVFFHYSAVENADFNDLSVGDTVRYHVVSTEDGRMQAQKVMVVH